MNDLGDDRKERDGRMGRDVMEKARERYFEIGRMMRKKYSTRRCPGGRPWGRQRKRLCGMTNKTENEGREEKEQTESCACLWEERTAVVDCRVGRRHGN